MPRKLKNPVAMIPGDRLISHAERLADPDPFPAVHETCPKCGESLRWHRRHSRSSPQPHWEHIRLGLKCRPTSARKEAA